MLQPWGKGVWELKGIQVITDFSDEETERGWSKSELKLGTKNFNTWPPSLSLPRILLLPVFLIPVVVTQSRLTLCDPIDCSLPGKNTGVGCHFLVQGISPTQGSNPSLLHYLHWEADSLPLQHLESPVSVVNKRKFDDSEHQTSPLWQPRGVGWSVRWQGG